MEKKLTFNEDPELYESIRPGYPERLIEDIIKKTSLNKGKRILEIGPGTGQLTRPFAEKGFSITGIELGKNLADFLNVKFSEHKNVKILNDSFEDWSSDGMKFDLIISAQAFHWIDKKIGYLKAAELLKSTGYFALIWIYTDSIDCDSEMQKVYKKYTDFEAPVSVAEKIEKRYSEIKDANTFRNINVFQYPYSIEYTGEEHIYLLNTYSDHILLSQETKSHLYRDIKDIINKKGGKIKRDYVAVLYLMNN